MGILRSRKRDPQASQHSTHINSHAYSRDKPVDLFCANGVKEASGMPERPKGKDPERDPYTVYLGETTDGKRSNPWYAKAPVDHLDEHHKRTEEM